MDCPCSNIRLHFLVIYLHNSLLSLTSPSKLKQARTTYCNTTSSSLALHNNNRCIGIVFCWGVFQEYLLRMDTLGPSTGAKELSWVGSLSCACIFVAAPAIVVLITNFGTTTVLASGIICVTTGFVAASFATTYWHLYITVVRFLFVCFLLCSLLGH